MDTEKPVDLFEERIRREMRELISDDDLSKYPDIVDEQEREQIRLALYINNFYDKIPNRDGIPMRWTQSLCMMVGDNRQELEAVLDTMRNSTMMDPYKDSLGGSDPENVALAMKLMTRYHSEMRVTQSEQEFVENIEVAIERSDVDREALMKYLDSMPVRHAYGQLTGGILIACRDREDDIGCREATLAYLDIIESDGQLEEEGLRFATEVREALEVQDPDYPGMERLLVGLSDERIATFMPSSKVNQELLFPVFIELRRMGYTTQDLRV